MTNYLRIGKIVSIFGLKGEVILSHYLGKKTSLKGLTTIFIEEKKDALIPWFIECAKAKSDEDIYLKLEGVDTREQAIRIIQKEVWLPEGEFKKYSSTSSPLNLLGYEIIEDNKVLGTILEVIEQPHQLLCKIMVNENEALNGKDI